MALDDPIGKYLADYPNREVATKVTVRHLLTHQGGTGEMGILEPQDGSNRASVRSIADIMELNGSRPPAFEPASQSAYSNYGFVLFGALVEKVAAHDYYDCVERHIFHPAAMALLPLLAEATRKQQNPYSYGFISSSFEDSPYWGHGGGAPGNSLVLDYYPVTDTSFICLSNRDPPICDRLAFNHLFRSPRRP